MERIGRGLAGLVLASGVAVLAGWYLDVHVLTSVVPGYASMKPNTALGLMVLAFGVLRLKGRGGACPGGAVAILGAATVLEYTLHGSLGIDRLLPGIDLGGGSARMAPATASALLLLGSAVVAGDLGRAGIMRALSMAGFAVGYLAVLGYLYGVSSLYNVGGYTSMAVHTATCVCLLSVAILLRDPERGLVGLLRDRGSAGQLMRPMVPFLLFAPAILGGLRLWAQSLGWFDTKFGVAILVMSMTVLGGALSWRAAQRLQESDRQRDRARIALVESNQGLERVVEERTADLNSTAQRLSTLVRLAPVGIVELDAAGGLLTSNEQWETWTGLDQNASRGVGWASAVHPEDVDRVRSEWAASAAAGLPYETTLRFVTPAGRVNWVNARTYPTRDRGVLTGHLGTITDVTVLRAAQDRFRLLLEAAPDAMLGVDSDGLVQLVNTQAERLFGYLRGELLGRPVEALVPDGVGAGDPHNWADYFNDPQARPTGAGTDLSGRRKNGSEFPAEISLSRLEGDDGRLVTAAIRDVTERKIVEQALHASEERLQLLVDSTPDYGILMLDPDGRIASWNAGAERLKGYTAAEAVGQHFSIFYPDEQRAAGHPQRELEVARAEGRYEEVAWRVRKDGSLFWANVVITAAYGEDGELRGFSKVTRDRTEQKKSEAKFEGLLEAAPDAMLGVDAGGLIRLVNTQAVQLFGYTRDELLGRPIETLVPERARAGHPHLRKGYFEDPRMRPMGAGADLSGRRKDGTEFPAEISLSSIQGEDGLLVTAAVRDVTERKALEAVVVLARDIAERAARSRQEFLANMSHEIRTPMNAVIGMTSLLLDTALDHVQRDYAETVRTSGEHLLTIINDILDYAKIDAGKLLLEELPFDVRDWLQETLEFITVAAHDKGLEIACDVAPEVPAVVVSDPARLRQVLVNLLSNAVKFTASGEVVVHVCLDRAEPHGLWMRIVVSDTGAGIPADRLTALFEPFTQGDSTTTRLYGGTGLGLAISRQLAVSLGGALTLASTPGAGTTVTFTFRVGTFRVGTADMAAVAPQATPSADRLAGRRMLIVDDNAASRVILECWAARHQMISVSADGAAQALQLIEGDQDFAVAVLDLMMPGVDGAQLGELLKAQLPATRLILMSSAGPYAHEIARPGTFDAVLSKPARQEKLFDLIATLIATGRAPETVVAPAVSAFGLPREKRSLSILVVEDIPVNQKVAQHLLARFGHRAEVAASGHEAISTLEHRDYDLVLMDVQMPEMDGLEATRLIRSRWPDRRLQIVAMTANVAPEDVRRCLDAGMDGFLGKPISVEALAQVLSVSGNAPPPPPPPPVPAPADPVLIDPAVVTRLCELIGVDQVREIADMFLAALDTAMPTIVAGCRDHDRELLASTAHRLKGSAGNFGAQNLGKLLTELEDEAPAADWPRLESLVARVQAQRRPTHDQLLAQLNQ